MTGMNRMSNAESVPSMSELCDTYKKLEQKLKEMRTKPTLEDRKKEIMDLLHEFNDVKDAAQVVIGVLANVEGKTIRELHLHYSLPTTE